MLLPKQERKKEKKQNKKSNAKIVIGILTLISISAISPVVCASSVDITPPTGKITIKNATVTTDGKKEVGGSSVIVGIEANDDISTSSEMKVYVSIDDIPDTKRIEEYEWENYSDSYQKTLKIPTGSQSSKVYAVIKDKAGNTNTVFSGTNVEYNLIYNANGGINAPATQKAYYGMPSKVTNGKPTYEGKYFKGWSTNKLANTASYYQGSTIPASVFAGAQSDITLYAVWADATDELPSLASMVQVGDYVNYPVNYKGAMNLSATGWRVLHIDQEAGTIELVSAGIPLTYEHYGDNSTSVSNLTTGFLTTTFAKIQTESNVYKASGFVSELEKTFSNRYTQKEGNLPYVRALSAEHIHKVTGIEITSGTNISNEKWNDLFKLEESSDNYWLATGYSSKNLLYVNASNGTIQNAAYGAYGVRPVVTLKSTVKTSGKDNQNSWELEMPQEQEITVTFNANGGETWATEMTVVVGDSYGPLPVPTKENHEFIGWYTHLEGGEEINEDTTVTTTRNQTIYAQWEKLIPILYNVVGVGDYVNYPVIYNDVSGTDETRWIVLSKNPDDLTVELTTVGVPLTYYYNYSYAQNHLSTIINDLTNNFVDIEVGTSQNQFQKNGFERPLAEIFDDQFVVKDNNGKPKVRSMNVADVQKIYPNATSGTDLSGDKILAIDQNYWLAYAADDYYLWYVSNNNQIANNYTGIYGIRPVVTMRADVKIIEEGSGDGTYNIAAKYNKVKINFETNGGTTTQKSKTVITGQKYGTLPIPVKKNREFLGWYTAQNGGTPVTEKTIVTTKTEQTLYAMYKEDMPDLYDQVSVGDYINYPVEYENVKIENDTSTLTGWRVLSKGVDLDGNTSEGTINIISAGTPLEYYHYIYAGRTKTAITTNFLTTAFGTDYEQYTKSGFISGDIYMFGFGEGESLTELFSNSYTEMKNGVPRVRSITSQDIMTASNKTQMATGTSMGLANVSDQLLANGTTYWTELDSSGLDGKTIWYVNANGSVSNNGTDAMYGIRTVVSLKKGIATPGKDENGVWKVERRPAVKSTVTFDANSGTVSTSTKTVVEGQKYGTLPTPVKEGDEFLGWYTSIENGTKITEETEVTIREDHTLYAIWKTGAALLANKVKVGDYVAYPVEYNNVEIAGDNVTSSLTGWRVLSINVDLDGNESIGTVNLISAGTPLEYYHANRAATTSQNMTTGFLDIKAGTETSKDYTFTKNGFTETNLRNVFNNKYTEKVASGDPSVRSLTTGDILRITGMQEMKVSYQMKLNDTTKYGTLFKNGTGYWTELAYSSTNVWYLGCDASVANDKYNATYGVRPVVSLKADVVSVGKDTNGAWSIDI